MTCAACFFDLFFGYVKTSSWYHYGQRLGLGHNAALCGDARSIGRGL